MNGRDQAPLVFVFSEPFTLALCCVLGGHLPSSRPVFRLRRPLPPLHALSCSWSSAELEAWIPDRNPASGNFAEAANDRSKSLAIYHLMGEKRSLPAIQIKGVYLADSSLGRRGALEVSWVGTWLSVHWSVISAFLLWLIKCWFLKTIVRSSPFHTS